MAIISSIIAAGAAIGASVGAGSAFTAAGAAIGAGVGAGVGIAAKGIVKGGKGGGEGSNAPIPLPQAPKVENAGVKASEIANKKRAAHTQTTFTNPLGSSGEAAVARKTLLGQ